MSYLVVLRFSFYDLTFLRNDNQSQPKKFPSTESGSSSYSGDANKVHVRSNKENSKPTEFYFKKPRTCTLLDVSFGEEGFFQWSVVYEFFVFAYCRDTSKIGRRPIIIFNDIRMLNHAKNGDRPLWIWRTNRMWRRR